MEKEIILLIHGYASKSTCDNAYEIDEKKPATATIEY